MTEGNWCLDRSLREVHYSMFGQWPGDLFGNELQGLDVEWT